MFTENLWDGSLIKDFVNRYVYDFKKLMDKNVKYKEGKKMGTSRRGESSLPSDAQANIYWVSVTYTPWHTCDYIGTKINHITIS